MFGVEPYLPMDTQPPLPLFDLQDPDEVAGFTIRELNRLGLHRAAALKQSMEQARKMKERYDADTNPNIPRPLEIGEFVRRRNHTKGKFELRWTGPFIVIGIGANESYRLQDLQGRPVLSPVNRNDLLPCADTIGSFYDGNRALQSRSQLESRLNESGLNASDQEASSSSAGTIEVNSSRGLARNQTGRNVVVGQRQATRDSENENVFTPSDMLTRESDAHG
jgi:hypothetical protein